MRGVRDVVPTFRSVCVYFDPLVTDVEALAATMRRAATLAGERASSEGRQIEIPVCYGGEFGPDLDDVAAFGRMERNDVIRAHTAVDYRVFMLGFVPGFAYMGIVDPRIAAPRRPSPRARVAAGSVGIAGEQTGVYPQETPGGWNIIGRTPLNMLTGDVHGPTLIRPGDLVTFRAIDRGVFDEMAAAR